MSMVHSGQEAVIPGELVARLEVASEGSRELDDCVVIAATDGEMMDWWDDAAQQHVIKASDGCRVNVTPVTTSLDAALALAERVLPGWAWSISGPDPLTSLHGVAFACLAAPETNGADEPWMVDRDVCTATGNTPALALCIAILKATTANSVGMSEANAPNTPPVTGEAGT